MVKNAVRVRLSLTEAGRMLLFGTLLFLLTAAVIPAFGVLTALIAVLLTAWLAGWVVRPRVRLAGDLPDSVVVDHRVHLHYTVTNTASVPVYDLHVAFGALTDAIELVTPSEVISRLAPGESADVTIAVRPRRRGYHRLPTPVCRSSFPFNLVRFSAVCKEEQSLTVLPVFYPLHMGLRGMSRHVRAGGTGFVGRTEVSPEYAGNRPFLPGDSPRRIDTRAWARLSVPATKEYHNDADSHAALVLDTRLPAGLSVPPDGEVPELEAAVSLCASVAFTLNDKCQVDLLLAGPDLHEYASWPRPARLNKMHEVLAGVEGVPAYSLDDVTAALTHRLYDMSEVVFILLNWDETSWQLLEMAARSGCHSRVLLVTSSPETVAEGKDARWIDLVRIISPEAVLAGHLERL